MTLEPLASAFLLGFLGSGHCLAMCGPLACAVGGGRSGPSTSARPASPLAYQVGRVATYGALGAAAGAVGGGLTRADSLGVAGRVVAALAGFALLLAAARTLGLGASASGSGAGTVWARLTRLVRTSLPARTTAGALGFGLVWGLLPCGLVYSAVLVSAASPGAVAGLLSMLAFGAGTAPVLLAASAASRRLAPLLARPSVRVGAALALLALGALQLSRAAAPRTPERPCCKG